MSSHGKRIIWQRHASPEFTTNQQTKLHRNPGNTVFQNVGICSEQFLGDPRVSFILFFVVLGIGPRLVSVLGQCPNTEIHLWCLSKRYYLSFLWDECLHGTYQAFYECVCIVVRIHYYKRPSNLQPCPPGVTYTEGGQPVPH